MDMGKSQEQVMKKVQVMPDSEENLIKAFQEQVRNMQAGKSSKFKRITAGEKEVCDNYLWHKC